MKKSLNIDDKYQVILASQSPRRKELLSALGIEFTTEVRPVEETFPSSLPVSEVAEYLSKKKAAAFSELKKDQLLITSDTVVIAENAILGKASGEEEARKMLRQLSGEVHRVVSGVCITTLEKQHSFSVATEVTFKSLPTADIDYYIHHYQPFDKAGAYGIQEWIGMIGIAGIKGSYYNVMGLPTAELYEALKQF
jgi:septum formation protein